jgi:dolichol-phosphate mannosyltransferase
MMQPIFTPSFDASLSDADTCVPHLLDLAVVVPTYNERANIAELIERLEFTLHGLAWELVFVDDDSTDGTTALIRDFASRDRHIRLVHRIGRRGWRSRG